MTAWRSFLHSIQPSKSEAKGQVEGSSPLPETEEGTRSRLTALGSRRAPIAPPNAPGDQGAQDLRQQRSVALDRGENDIATTGLNVGNYAMSGVGAAAASGRSLTGLSSGLTDTNWNSGLTGGLSVQRSGNLIFARRSDGHVVIFYYQ